MTDLRGTAAALVVVRAQLGDRAALDTLLRAVQEPLLRHIQSVVRDSDAASDVLQDVLLTIAEKLGALRDPRWFRAWAFRIATRQAIRHATRVNRRDEMSDPDLLDTLLSTSADEPLFDPDIIAALPDLVADLPSACSTVVRLRYLDELSVTEIAEALEIPEGTVKSRLSYGLATLRRRLTAAPNVSPTAAIPTRTPRS